MTIRVAVVDDQALVRRGFAMVLDHQEDIDVIAEAGTGLEAIEASRQHRPDVVLMDIRMPEMDGLTATATILDEADWPLKVIILTTFDPDEYVYRALRAGASGFILKDIPPESLAPAIRTVADGGALLDPSITRRLIGRFAQTLASDTATARRLDTLTDREREVLSELGRGASNAEISETLYIGAATREEPCLQHPHQARAPRSRPGRRVRLRKRPHHTRPPRHRALSHRRREHPVSPPADTSLGGSPELMDQAAQSTPISPRVTGTPTGRTGPGR